MTKRKQQINLIEILVVSLVLVILVVVTVPKFMKSQDFATIAQVVQDFELLTKALHAYELDHGSAPPDFDGTGMQYAVAWYGAMPRSEIFSYRLLTTPVSYIDEIPIDPYLEIMGGVRGKDVPYYEYSQNIFIHSPPFTVRWNISSAGPDLMEDFMFSHYDHLEAERFAYHTSNGLLSRGDIYASNHGIVYPF